MFYASSLSIRTWHKLPIAYYVSNTHMSVLYVNMYINCIILLHSLCFVFAIHLA